MANQLDHLNDLKFFGNELLMALQPQLAFGNFVNRDYSGASAAAGSTVRVPWVKVSGEASERSMGQGATANDTNSGYVDVEVSHIYAAAAIDNLVDLFSNVDVSAKIAKDLAYKVARKANAKIASQWYKFPYEAGTTDGTSAFASNVNVFAKVRQILLENGAPVEDINAMLSPGEVYNLQTLSEYKSFQVSGDTSGLRTGSLKPFYGIMPHEAPLVESATLSTSAQWGTPLINNGAGYAIGASSIAVDGLGTGTIKKGSTFKLGDYRYSVTADATITANAATLSIFPVLQASVADNAALTPTAHSAAGSQNMAFHENAIIAVARTMPALIGKVATTVTDPDTGFSLRIALESNVLGGAGVAYTNNIAVDFVFGAAVVQPELGVRIIGA